MIERIRRGKGRPVKGSPKTTSINVRMSMMERAHLNYLTNMLGKGRSEIMRMALEKLYENESSKH